MAFIAYSLFLSITIVGRILLQYRLTNDHGVRLASTESSMLPKVSGILFVGSFVVILYLTLLEARGRLTPPINLGLFGTLIGSLFCLIGTAVTAISQYQMGKAWRIGVNESERTELITHGWYAYVRNPIYSGLIIFALGLLAFIPHPYMLIGLIIGYLSIELQVRYVEEPYLIRLHGAAYEAYCRETNRYFPSVFRKK